MLLLFDIDGTLVDTGGAGLFSIRETVAEIFGSDGPPLDLAGATDKGLMRGFFEHFGREYDPAVEAQFYEAYLSRLKANLKDPRHRGRLLGGVKDLLSALVDDDHVLGLLTGNIERGAYAKVRHFEIHEPFGFGAYGDDHWDRNKLGPIAVARAEQVTGKRFSPDEVLVIGDTPKDVACAHAFGAQCLAVATGSFTEEQLEACGADRVVSDLVGFSL